MALSFQIRAATPEDAAGLAACMRAAYGAYEARMAGTRLPPLDVDYADEIASYPTWIACTSGHIVGGLIMSFEARRAFIANIAVAPTSQGQGIGGALMRFAETQATERRCAELHLATHVMLTENLALYRHLGWRETSRDEVRVFMKKDLEASP